MKNDIFSEYKEKRDFSVTQEPFPEEGSTGLISYAIPKAKLPDKGEKLFLTETEVHPTSYIHFSGPLKEGYGAGHVKIVDKGFFEILDVSEDKIEIYLKGDKIKGKYAIIFTKNKDYLIINID